MALPCKENKKIGTTVTRVRFRYIRRAHSSVRHPCRPPHRSEHLSRPLGTENTRLLSKHVFDSPNSALEALAKPKEIPVNLGFFGFHPEARVKIFAPCAIPGLAATPSCRGGTAQGSQSPFSQPGWQKPDPQRAPVNTPAESNKAPGCLSRTQPPHAETRPPCVAGEGQRRRAGA